MILRLQGISQGEEFSDFKGPFPDTADELIASSRKDLSNRTHSLHKRMLRVSFPRVITHETLVPADFYASYVQTWLEKGVAQLTSFQDTSTFFHL